MLAFFLKISTNLYDLCKFFSTNLYDLCCSIWFYSRWSNFKFFLTQLCKFFFNKIILILHNFFLFKNFKKYINKFKLSYNGRKGWIIYDHFWDAHIFCVTFFNSTAFNFFEKIEKFFFNLFVYRTDYVYNFVEVGLNKFIDDILYIWEFCIESYRMYSEEEYIDEFLFWFLAAGVGLFLIYQSNVVSNRAGFWFIRLF